MKREKIAKLYDVSATELLLTMAKYEKELAEKDTAEAILLTTITTEQKKLFDNYQEAWNEVDTILEREAFRQGVVTAEKVLAENQHGGHSLKIESGR